MAMTTLLERQLNECGTWRGMLSARVQHSICPSIAESVLQRLQDSLAVLSPELVPIHERLVNIRRKLVALAAKETAREAAVANGKPIVLTPEPLRSQPASQAATPPPGDDSRSTSDKTPTQEGDGEAKTPTKETTPKPELPPAEKEGIKVKSELKALMEELRKIDSLSIVYLRDRELTDVNCCSVARRFCVACPHLSLSCHAFLL